MIATTVIFAVKDGISRYLAENYNVITVVTIRHMFFMCFVLAYISRQKGGVWQMASSDPALCLFATGFTSSIGILVFVDSLDPMLFIGGGIIVNSGLFALQREHKVKSH